MASLNLRSSGTTLTNQQVDDNFQNIINALGATNTTIPTPTGTGGPALKDSPTFTTHIFGGTQANTTRFPSAFASISSVSTGAVSETTTNIGLIAEAVGSGSNYGVGLYGVGYATGTLRGTGVTGEGHVVLSGDTGSAIGVRGYSNDTHSGGLNVGLFGDASGSSVNNYALYMNAGNIYSNAAQTWTFSTGGLTLSSAITAPSFVSNVATGTAPFTVSSSTNVANLNASSLNGATFASPGAIGGTTASSGAFTTLSASSTVSGSGFSTYLASPPNIGGTTAAEITGTTITSINSISTAGIYAKGIFSGTYTDGVVTDYTTGFGRISVGTADGIAFYNGGVATTELMRLDASGNLGIGVASPGQRLDVGSGSINCRAMFTGSSISTEDASIELGGNRTGVGNAYLDLHSQSGSDSDFRLIKISGANGDGALQLAGTGNLIFATNGPSGNAGVASERMRISSTGDVRIGTSSQYTSALLSVAGAIASSSGYYCHAGTGAGTTFGGNIFNTYWAGSSIQAWIDSTNIGNFTITSDYRIKKNIKTNQTPALERVAKLRPVTYEFTDYGTLYKADGVKREGFIAHELAEVIPSAVEGEKDAENQIQSLKLDALVSVLTKAIQEQQALIIDLTDRIKTLENK